MKPSLGLQESNLPRLGSRESKLLSRIKKRNITYLSDKKLISLATTCQTIEQNSLPGIFLEAGCALGGSSILIASLKRFKRPLFIYDVFEMIPPPTKKDSPEVHERYKIILEGKSRGIGGDKYYGYEENLYEIVKSNLENFGVNCDSQSVSLIKGLLQETMIIDQPVSFAHIDVDWYEPVMTCLQRVFPNLVIGGCMILDDYHDWGGCKKATDEYLQSIPGQFVLDDTAESMKITKVENIKINYKWTKV